MCSVPLTGVEHSKAVPHIFYAKSDLDIYFYKGILAPARRVLSSYVFPPRNTHKAGISSTFKSEMNIVLLKEKFALTFSEQVDSRNTKHTYSPMHVPNTYI